MTLTSFSLRHFESNFAIPGLSFVLNSRAVAEDAYKWPAELCSSDKGKGLLLKQRGEASLTTVIVLAKLATVKNILLHSISR